MTKPPDPNPDCPRCYYFAHTQDRRDDDRMKAPQRPPIDQGKALAVLTKAFPRAYGVKG